MTIREDDPPVFTRAVQHWWASKKKNQESMGETQAGSRGANLRGDTMDGFRNEIRARLVSAGVHDTDIFSAGHLSSLPSNLPSYFRATKNWDIVVCKNSRYKRFDMDPTQAATPPQLIAAIEFKSQEGSIGNNQNNRIEESIGSATDFWASYENKNFVSLQPRPWLGYLFVGCYEDGDIDKGVDIKQPHFLTDPAFDGVNPADRLSGNQYTGPSYAQRYRVFLERMIAKKLYDGACFIVTNRTVMEKDVNHRCIFPELSGDRFIDLLLRHVTAYYPD